MSFTMNRRRWIGLSLAGLAGAGALAALLAAPALGGGGGGWFGHGHGGFGRHGHHRLSEEQIRDRLEWMLRDVDASDEQLDRITQVATTTVTELRGLHDAHRGAREQVTTALGGATVDRAALETLRAEHIAAADEASRKITDALAQIAEVLTPEQRAELVAQHAKHHARHEREQAEQQE
ncbi:MAG TPA: Spy/CpxP family protein refolding chaperone [Myxococcota bacterium]|nr:Spy/CpxP family protein refolding chaperone [Myxococcota bacterium]